VIDARRYVVPVRAAAEEEGHFSGNEVLAGHGGELALDRQLRRMIGQPLDGAGEPRRFRHIDEQLLDRGGADCAQHFTAIGFS
jgi:hypothetical protein